VSAVGLFGGTFDPIHIGHLSVAQDVHAALGLDRVLFVPARVPPHRDEPYAPAEARLEMVRAAIEGDERFGVWAGELEREGPSWTVDTVAQLGMEQPEASLNLILGADQFGAFSRWRAPDEISKRCRLVVVGRSGTAAQEGSPWPHRSVEITRIDVSSSMIRARIAAGAPLRYLVPDPVIRIIERGAWYKSG